MIVPTPGKGTDLPCVCSLDGGDTQSCLDEVVQVIRIPSAQTDPPFWTDKPIVSQR